MSSVRAPAVGPGEAAVLLRDPVPGAEAFLHPIEFLAGEHERQLSICAVLERLLHNPRHGVSQAQLQAVREYLANDLPLHMLDEEEDLFPLLRRCCPAEDNIQEVFALLREEHRADAALKEELCRDLDVLIRGQAFSDPARFLMNAFAFTEIQRRHLAWENAVILPRARRHLSEADCAGLGQRMAARRGLGPAD